MENINDYRIVVIDEEGLIRYFGEINEYRFHRDCLKDYLYTYYNDMAKKENVDGINEELKLIYFLTNNNNVVFNYSPGYGLLFLPKEVSDMQLKSLYDLFASFEKIPIYINYDLHEKYGKIVSQQITDIREDLNNTELLDAFFRKGR